MVNSTSYVFRDTDHAAGLFNLEEAGHIYSRISNPTVAVFEERIAALEGGVGAVATASGQSAFHLAAATILSAGDHVVSSAAIYGGTHNLLNHTLRRFGIETTFVEPTDPANFRRAARPNTKLFFGETIGNPRIDVLDIPAVADLAHETGVPLLIDNTFGTPFLSRPIELGADIVMHSATKFIGGHGVTLGGVLVDSGKFDWAASGRFPIMTEPCPGYHGIAFAEHYGPPAFILKARLEGLRDFGACLNPQAAFYLLQGLETLPLRVARHVENAREIAGFPGTARGRRVGELSPTCRATRSTSWPGSCCRRAAARCSPSGFAAVSRRGSPSSRALSSGPHLANVGDAKSLGHSPGEHDASADDRRGTCRVRRDPGDGAALGRPGGSPGPHSRSRPGAQTLAAADAAAASGRLLTRRRAHADDSRPGPADRAHASNLLTRRRRPRPRR